MHLKSLARFRYKFGLPWFVTPSRDWIRHRFLRKNPDALFQRSDRVAKEAEVSLHAGVSTEAHQRDKPERLCRYVEPTQKV
jgi:hypothetical protein